MVLQSYNYFYLSIDKNKKNVYNNNRSKYGEVAQLARAFGSYPKGHVFESHLRYQFYKRIFFYKCNIIFLGYLRIERGSYHARDGLKRDVGYAVQPINHNKKRDAIMYLSFLGE